MAAVRDGEIRGKDDVIELVRLALDPPVILMNDRVFYLTKL